MGIEGKDWDYHNKDCQKNGPVQQELRPLRRRGEPIVPGTRRGFNDVGSGREKGLEAGTSCFYWGEVLLLR